MAIDEKMANDAVQSMTALRYFPTNAAAHTEIGWLLMRMVVDQQQLEWLVEAMIDRVGEWPGTKELRAIFCTRFKPLDGIEEWSTLRGFSAIDSERAVLEAADSYKSVEIAAPRQGGLKWIGDGQ